VNPLLLIVKTKGGAMKARLILFTVFLLSLMQAAAYADLPDNSVTTAKIVDGAVTTAKIARLAVATSKIRDRAVTTRKIANGAITTIKIADNAVTSSKIATDAVGSSEIAANAVGSSEIADGAVATADLADGAVTSAKVLDGTITGADIADEAITASDLATDSVGSAEIAAGAVTQSEAPFAIDGDADNLKLARGETTVSLSTTGFQTKTGLAFNQTFTSTPTVVLGIQYPGTTAKVDSLKVTAVTTATLDLAVNVNATDSVDATIRWFAIGQ